MTTTPDFSKEIPQSLWDTSDVARFLGCSDRQIYALRKRGLPSMQVGGLVRFRQAEVTAWLERYDARGTATSGDDLRARQLADIAVTGDEDNAECAAADLSREFPGSPA